MSRRIAMTAALLVAVAAPAASAQYGWYGRYGWGGWGGGQTVQGSIAQGMGVFAAGAGQYNLDTAAANQINANTWMGLNEYLYQSEQIRRQKYYQEVAARKKIRREASAEIQDRHLNNPGRADIVSGDALNALLHQLRDPKIPDSTIENAGSNMTLTGEQIRHVPLKFNSRGTVISAHRLAADNGWPAQLMAPEFEPLRNKYMAMVEEARNRPEGEEIPDAKIVEAINVIEQMRDLAKQRLSGPDYAAAERYLKAHAGLLQMARQPDIRQVLQKAYEQDQVALPRALQFMDVFNLEFGPAKDPEEVELYLATLYPMLKQLHATVAEQLGNVPPTTPAVAGQAGPIDAFAQLPWEQVGRDEPLPPAPANER